MIENEIAANLLPYLEEISEGQQFYIKLAAELPTLLETYIYQHIQEGYPELPYSIDGLQIVSAKKLDSYSAEIYGMAFLLENQSKAPFYVCLSLDISGRSLEAAYIRLGDSRWKGAKTHIIETLNAPIDEIDWRYVVESKLSP